ncbi:DUF2169 domain-containing protein [Chitinimonas arctica]|uniref:DUF2169 domain-containing protein n=1 Tax=Chitinimonas arctica TaxID=2594795 RepID=A0A516SK29_9NEIS|nr:DUF2169 domain-containing protein [Chitinimonas arctica]QDQ28504.1 DUF2169 domain-containing protein [Chitinimonas arctica]
MKIVKPASLGLLQRPYRYQGQDRLAIAALGFFPLGRPTLRFLDEAAQWRAVLAALPPGKPIDELFAMPNGQLLLAGAAYAPGGVPVESLQVRVGMGGVDKRLTVLGERRWFYGPWYRQTAPQAFVRMPLDEAHAYGGPGHPQNPLGRGYTGNPLAGWLGRNEGELPNVEDLQRPVRGHVRPLPPAGFGPLDPSRQPRLGWAGQYDRAWLLDEAPGLARDLDPRFFQTAPADQWQDGPWRGDEHYRLENLHADHPLIEGQLPGFAARAFVRDQADGQVREAGMRLDTVWFLPDALLGVAVFHGELAITHIDGLDLDAVMVGYEPLDAPREPAHYQAVLQLRTALDSAIHQVLREDQLAPAWPEDIKQERAAQSAARLAARRERRQALRDEYLAEAQAQAGVQPQPALPPLLAELAELEIDFEAIATGEADTAAFIAQATELAERAKREGEARLAEQAAQQAPPAPLDPEEERRRRYARAAEPAWDLLGEPAPPGPLNAQLDHALGQGALTPRQHAAALAGQARLPALRRQGRCMRLHAAEPAPSPELAAWLGGQVRQWRLAGVPLVGRDLAGADLAGMDLRGADLREACFERADLRGAQLAGADLRAAGFAGAQLQAADLRGCRLQGANFSDCEAADACFDDADLSRALGLGGDFGGASFRRAKLDDALFRQANLTAASLCGASLVRTLLAEIRADASQWQGAKLVQAILMQAQLAGADFSGAELQRVVLLDAVLDGGCWEASGLDRCVALGASAVGLRAAGMQARGCGWRKVNWQAADLRAVRFVDCDLGEGDFSGAILAHGLFARCLLHGACLQDCQAQAANFLQAMCRGADFRRADLRDASLRQAVMDGADLRGAQLAGSLLDAVVVQRLNHRSEAIA